MRRTERPAGYVIGRIVYKLELLELLPIEVLHCGNREFRRFLLPRPWHWRNDFRYELDSYCSEMYRKSESELSGSRSRLSKVIVWHADRHDRKKEIHCIRYWLLLIPYSKRSLISSSAIAERPRCRVGELWPKVKQYSADNIGLSSTTVLWRNRPATLSNSAK